MSSLERAHDIAREQGLDFVCRGNVLGHRAESLACESTYCPECGELLIRRWELSVAQYRLKDEKCPQCGRAIPVVTGAAGPLR